MEEYYDTSKDSRVLMLEQVVGWVRKRLQNRKIPFVNHGEFLRLLDELAEVIKRIKWSYKPPSQLKDLKGSFDELLEKLKSLVVPKLDKADKDIQKIVRYLLRNLETFWDRFLGDLTVESVVPVFGVKIISFDRHPQAKKLYVAWVTNGKEKMEIVTNDGSLKRGEVVPLAVLPPKEFMGILSEGMFIGGEEGIRRLPEDVVGKRIELLDDEKKKLMGELINAVNALKR